MAISYEELHRAIQPVRMTDSIYSGREFLPIRYRYDSALSCGADPERYLRLVGSGRMDIAAPFSVSIQPVDALFLLCSLQGAGQAAFSGSVQTVGRGSIFLFPCRCACRLSSASLPWSFRLFFAAGPDLENFLPLLGASHLTTSQGSPFMASAMEELASYPETVSLRALLHIHRLLTDILSDACLASLPAEQDREENVPAYLQDLHTYIHDCQNLEFSLERFETLYGISRYRLCREYSAAYRIPPLKDFNQVRMEEAKKMLLNTHLQVQEISSRLGYENTNHFIRLFKAQTGLTPGAFRAQLLS